VFIAQSKGPALHQFDFVVEPFGPAIGVTMPHVARNRFQPPTERPRQAVAGCQRTRTRLLNEFPKRRARRFVIATLEPLAQGGSVSKVEMTTPMALICKALFPSISTFETPPLQVTNLSGASVLTTAHPSDHLYTSDHYIAA
jgi:hypothetical protein